MNTRNKIYKLIFPIIILFIGTNLMAESQAGYRALPPEINHPSKSKIFSKSEFDELKKNRLEEASPVCKGHKGTVIWYVDKLGYIIQIQFEKKPDIYISSICTFTPTMGMDKIDGEFAQDVETFILERELGFKSNRLDIFKGSGNAGEKVYQKQRKVTLPIGP